jgi:hypothetical protein
MPMWVFAVILIAINSFGAVGIGPQGIGYLAHLGGALFGFIYFQSGFTFGRLFRRSPAAARPRAKPQLRVVPIEPEEDTPAPVGAPVESPPQPKERADEHLEARLDAVLDKVSKHGEESLTPEEREILFKASELYKKRRK